MFENTVCGRILVIVSLTDPTCYTNIIVSLRQMRTTPDGMTYVQRYSVQSFPHLAIIDPRTGRLVWRKEGWTQVNPMTAEMFAEIAADFCSRHSFDKPPVAPKVTSSSNGGEAVKSAKRPIEEMTEDEQLQAALKASMAGNAMDEDSDDELVVDEHDIHNVGSPEKKEGTKSCTMADEFGSGSGSVQVGEEPSASDSDAVRIQFRMPEGQKVVRRFRRGDSIKVIYAFVVQNLDEAKKGKPFQLRAGFPPKDLYSEVESGTVESCGLAGGQIMASWQ